MGKEEIREWIEQEQGKHFCQCGCGSKIKVTEKHYYRGIAKYKCGHNLSTEGRKKKPLKRRLGKVASWIKQEQGKHFCQCGCGTEIKIIRRHHYAGIPKYILGHNSHTKEGKVKLREMRALQKAPPQHHTKPERIFEDICKRNNIDFHYVGDSSLWIGKDKKLNPDFIEANGKKICVEIMGTYWHSRLLNQNLREDVMLAYRKKHYRRYKWHSIFIWDTDLLREDAEQFVLNTLQKERVI